MNHLKTVCLDLDGVLAQYHGWKDGEIGPPLEQGKLLAEYLKNLGYRVVISTCRTHPESLIRDEQIQLIASWLKKHRIPYDHLEIQGKPMAHIYVDDRGLFFDQNKANNPGYAMRMASIIVERLIKEEPE